MLLVMRVAESLEEYAFHGRAIEYHFEGRRGELVDQ
jgi:hypothetical protein